jgi:hypothetical protein
MNRRKVIHSLLSTAFIFQISSVFAHHSGTMFDRAQTVTIEGTVTRYDYVNPHSWIILTVQNDSGDEALWGVEGFSPASMRRWGLTPETVKPGETIRFTVHPLRDGRNGGSLITATLANSYFVDTTSEERLQAPRI